MNEDPIAKATLDLAAGVAVLASFIGWLPAVAAIVALAYHGIQIWETETVRLWTGRKRPPSPFDSLFD